MFELSVEFRPTLEETKYEQLFRLYQNKVYMRVQSSFEQVKQCVLNEVDENWIIELTLNVEHEKTRMICEKGEKVKLFLTMLRSVYLIPCQTPWDQQEVIRFLLFQMQSSIQK